MKVFYILLALPALLLGGCVEQSVADSKMARGCSAVVGALIEPKAIIDITNTKTETKDFEGEGNHRFITISVKEKDGWLELDNEYQCVFLEQWGMFQSSHTGLLMQAKIGDEYYGKHNGKIKGTWEDFVKLSSVADAAMAK